MLLRMILLLQSDVNELPIGNVPVTGGLSQLYVAVFSFIFVCVLAYFSSKLLSSSKSFRGRSSMMKIVDSLSIGYQKNLQIIRVGEKYYLISVTKDRISFLSEIPKEDLVNDSISDSKEMLPEKNMFEKYLKQFISKNKEH